MKTARETVRIVGSKIIAMNCYYVANILISNRVEMFSSLFNIWGQWGMAPFLLFSTLL